MSTIRTVVYLSGPMSGLPEHNYPAFDQAELELSQAGYDVLSPARITRPPYRISTIHHHLRTLWAAIDETDPQPAPEQERASWRWFMRRAVMMQYCAQAVATLPLPKGWISTGMQEELRLASVIHQPVYTVEHLLQNADWARRAQGDSSIRFSLGEKDEDELRARRDRIYENRPTPPGPKDPPRPLRPGVS